MSVSVCDLEANRGAVVIVLWNCSLSDADGVPRGSMDNAENT